MPVRLHLWVLHARWNVPYGGGESQHGTRVHAGVWRQPVAVRCFLFMLSVAFDRASDAVFTRGHVFQSAARGPFL